MDLHEAQRPGIEAPGIDAKSRARRRVGWRSRAHWGVLGFAAASLIALLVLGSLLTPSPEGHGTHEQLGLPPCAMMKLTGVPCPGCGVTTAVSHFARGELVRAFLVQPFGVLVGLSMVAVLPLALWGELARRDLGGLARRLLSPRWLAVAGAALFASWVYKLVVVLA